MTVIETIVWKVSTFRRKISNYFTLCRITPALLNESSLLWNCLEEDKNVHIFNNNKKNHSSLRIGFKVVALSQEKVNCQNLRNRVFVQKCYIFPEPNYETRGSLNSLDNYIWFFFPTLLNFSFWPFWTIWHEIDSVEARRF